MSIKKSILIILIFTATLLFVFTSQASAAPSITRLFGTNRYETAAAIAKEGWTQSDYAVLAFGENYPDALAAAPLAKKFDAPILLTTKDNLGEQTKQVLQDLEVKKVFIIGGSGVISDKVQTQLSDMGIEFTRLSGQDRYETSVKIAEQLGNVDGIVVTTGNDYSDALSVASIAANKNMPIILADKDELSSSVKNYISNHKVNKTYIIGNIDIISKNIENFFDNPERIFGSDNYDKNITILMKFYFDINPDTIILTSGNNFADALTGAAYAAKKSSPIILINDVVSAEDESYIYSLLAKIKQITVLGGEGTITGASLDDLRTKMNYASGKINAYKWSGSSSSNSLFYIGEAENNKANGKGIFLVDKNVLYYGEVKEGYATGLGTEFALDGSKYVGEWNNNYYSGEGTKFYSDGSTYEGNWKGEKRDGKGTFIRFDGLKYTGGWLSDKESGYGILTWLNGDKYEGNFQNDYMNGQGTYTWADGTQYSGLWKNELRFGRGIQTWPNGNMYEGNWENGKMNGQGTYTWANGEKYIGEYKDGKQNGQGTYTWPNGEKYTGEFKDDTKDGQGIYTWPSGEKYTGEYKDDKRNGFGISTYEEGDASRYEGNWLDDEKNGEGTTYYRNGKQSTDMWDHNKILYNIK